MTCDVRTPTRVFIGLTLALAMVVAWPGENRQTVWAQEDQNELFFRVTDATSGALVTDMTPEEFVVTQEGVPCEVVSAELVATRLQLAVLLDDSVGMMGFRQNMLNGMPGFFDALPEGSEVSLITMAQRPRTLLDFSTDMALVREAFGDYYVQPGRGSVMLDALLKTADDLMKEDGEDGVPEGGTFWPHIAYIGSNGGDVSQSFARNPQRQIEELMPKLQEVRATMHFYILESRRTMGLQHQLADNLTTATGGWFDRVAGSSLIAEEKLAVLGAAIAERYAARANQYRVVFTRPPDSESTAGFGAGVRRPGVAVQVSSDGRPR